MKITIDEIELLWSKEQLLTINGVNYSVHKMSYGDWFLEPAGYELPETEGFAKGTKWLRKIGNGILEIPKDN